MTSSPVRSALWCVPVAHKSVFRLEAQVAGSPTVVGTHKFEYVLCGEKWIMEVKYSNVYGASGFAIDLRAPESTKTFAHRPYTRTNDKDTQYHVPGSWMNKNGTFIVGAEVTMESSALPTSSWTFASSEQMDNWDVVLCVGDMKFYAHKTVRIRLTQSGTSIISH
ncbi:hypothetical protein AAVH_33127 [Aphelenchoides avenae]|nr:hypothetical protein AAVH_33127 [Aphelenchus avenae]